MGTSSRKKAAAANLATDAKLAKAEKMVAASKKAAAAKKVAAAKKAIAERKAKKDAVNNELIPSNITVTKETSNDNASSSDSSSSSESLEDDERGKLEGEIRGKGDESSIETPDNVVRKKNKKSTVGKDKTKEGKDKVPKKRKRKSTEDISTVETTKKSKTDVSVVTERKETTKVEESFIIRDKKRLDIYVCKCVKSQKKAMKTAQIHEKTQFAQRIKTEFLKGKWSKELVKEFQDPTNFKKLWWGETPYISLGTQFMTALKVTRNAMAKRVVDTKQDLGIEEMRS
eukprot:scaffold13574_cov44-Attheya_sp.AAC.5